MNKSYKSVWNESTGAWVAVSELATGRSKSKRAKTAISKAILTQIAVGGLGLAGASIAMAGDPVKFGTDSAVNVADGVAIGTDATVDADIGANASKTGGVAIGDQSYAVGSGVAIGQNTQAGSDSLAIGTNASAALGSTAIGLNARSFNKLAVALGENASAGGEGSMALGANATSEFKNATAIGSNATTDRTDSLSVGNATTKRQITNVADGTQDSDAVTLKQLKGIGVTTNTDGTVTNAFVAYDSTSKNTISLLGASGTKITNVAAGAVTAASKDAINGSQLLAVAQSAATAVGGSSTVGADGTISKPVYKINNVNYTSLDSALTAAAASGSGGTGGSGTDALAVHYDAADQKSVSLGNAGTPVKLTNVATGTADTDAVNVAQLTTATTGLKDAVSATKYIAISKSMQGDSAVATGNNAIAVGAYSYATGDNSLAFGAKARATAANSIAIGAGSLAGQANTVSIGAPNSERRLTNVANGTDDMDAVNLSQMKDYVENSVAVQNVQSAQSTGLLKSSVRNTGLLGAAQAFALTDVMSVGATDKLGQIEALGPDAIAMGLNTHANGDSAVAIGSNTSSAGLTSVGVGYGVIVNGTGASAFGNNSTVISDGGLALGMNANVEGNSNNGIAIGTGADSASTEAIAIGYAAKSYGTDSIVLGNTAKATGVNSILIGTGSTSTTSATGSVVIGNGNSVTGANTVVLGSNMVGTGSKKNVVSGKGSVVLGDGSDGSLDNVVSVGAAGKERKIVNVAAGTTTTDAVNFGQLTAAMSSSTPSPEAVTYDTTAHDKLTLGGTGATVPVTLANVAKGKKGTDAVNVDQLAAMGGTVDSNGNPTNAFVAYDNTSMDTVTLKGTTAGTTKITKLTNGTLSATSSDAVNGSQLFNTASSTAAAIGGGAALDPATGTISKPAIKVGTTTYDNVAGAVVAAGTAATNATAAVADAVMYNSTTHDKVTLGGTASVTPVTLSNVAAGKADTDAVNVKQLTAMGGTVDSSGNATNVFVAYDNTSMDTITLKGKTAGTTKITKLTNGTLSAASSDAVNGSQLFNTASSTAAAIGGGAALDPNTGTISKPAIKVGDTTYDTLAGAIGAAALSGSSADSVVYDSTKHDKVTLGGTASVTPVTLSNVAAGKADTDAVNVKQLTAMGGTVDSSGNATNVFVAYDNTSMDTITLKGKTAGTTKITKLTNGTLSAASSDAVNGSQLFNTASSTAAAIGGGAALDPATGTISKPAIKVGTTTYDNVAGAVVAAGTAATNATAAVADAVMYNSTTHDKVTLGGTASTTPVLLSNVAAGKADTDAVNVKQLTAMGGTVDSSGNATNVFVAYDNTSMDTITLKGKTAGTTKITKLTNGTLSAASSDAVNGSQLFNTASSTAAAIGGGAALDPATGTISKPAIKVGTTTYDNVAGAVVAAGTAATNATAAVADAVMYNSTTHDKVTLGGTASTTPVLLSNVAAGKADTDAVNVKQLTAMGGTVDSSGNATNVFVAYDNTSMDTITLKGKTAGTTKITKLTNGTLSAASSDAVNGSQLFNTASTAAAAIGGGAALDPATGKISKPSIVVGGTTYDNVAGAVVAAGTAATNATAAVADAVMYNSTTHDHVTFGGTAATAPVVLSNVAQGTKGTDAVNLDQLTALGLQVDSNGKALNAFVAYDTAAKGSVTLNAGGAAVTVSNVKAGVADTDAVNVAQLNTAVSGNVQLANNLKYVKFGASTALTANATGTDSMALGGNAFASGKGSLALGLNARATAENSVAIGVGSLAGEKNVVSVGTASAQRRIVNVGDATDDYDAVNLHTVEDMLAKSTAANAVKTQGLLQAGATRSLLGATTSTLDWTDVIATGPSIKQKDIQALGTDAVAVGISTHANGEQSVAFGSNVTTSADFAVGFGSGVIVNGLEATAIGVNANVIADHGLAVGYNASAESTDSIAVGSNAYVSAPSTGTSANGVAIGNKAFVSGDSSIVLGNKASVSGANTVVIGNNVKLAKGSNSVVLGNGSDGSQDNVISVGAKGTERKIVNVAAGTTTTDAVNLGQMTAAIAAGSTGGTGGTSYVTQAAAGNDLLVGAATDGKNVNFAGTAGARQLTGVANGTASGSAVTYDQLSPLATALGTTIDPTTGAVKAPSFTAGGKTATTVQGALENLDTSIAGNTTDITNLNTKIAGLGDNLVTQAAAGSDIMVASKTDGAHVNFAGTGVASRELINVSAGTTDTSAVNLSQLKPVVAALGGGAAVSAAGVVTAPTYTIGGNDLHNAGDAFKALDNSVTGLNNAVAAIGTGGSGGTGGTNYVTQAAAGNDLMVGAATDGKNVNFTGLAGARQLTGVANGTASGSAVTYDQLSPLATALGTTIDPTTGAVKAPSFTAGGKTATTVQGALENLDTTIAGNTTDITNLNTKIAGLGDNLVTQAAAGSDIMVASKTDGAHVNFAGTGVASRELINVSAGTTDTSAVNLSQLKPVVAALGGGAAVSTAGVVTGPTYTIGGNALHNAGDAFEAVDGKLTSLNDTVAGITGTTGNGMVVQNQDTRDITVGAVNDGTRVNFAGTAGNRVLTGVAGGSLVDGSVDAVNGSQLFNAASGLATAIGGGAALNSDGSITQPTFIVDGKPMHNMGDAISNIDSRVTNNYTDLSKQISNITAGGAATPNAVAYDSAAHDQLTLGGTAADGSATTTKITGVTAGDITSATSTDAVNGGQLYATNEKVASLQNSVDNFSSTGSSSIGITGATGATGAAGAPGAASATGSDAIAMGDKASASGDHTVVIGGGASGTADGTIAIGGNAGASGKDSIAIGNGATAPATSAVALGAGSVADRDNSVSVGSAGSERQITNVAAGTQGTDAVNLNQMNSAVGGIARKAYSGIAAATALTMIPDVDANKTLSIGIGGGTFQGYAATAIGGTARITQNIKVRVGAGWSAAGTTVGAGASYQW